jgi:hypothetical protein
VPRVPLPNVGITPHWGDVYSISCENVTPRSLLLRTHSPIPSGSSVLRPKPRARSLRRLLPAPAAIRDLPDVISANLSSDAWSPTTAVPRSAYTCFFLRVIGLPPERSGSASRFFPRIRLLAGGVFEAADISLCSGLRVCSSPRSFLPLRNVPQGSRDFYIRAERASLPLHAPDMLADRIQAIDGTRTFTLLDSQPCRPLPSPPPHTAQPVSRELPVDPYRDHRWGFPCCVWSPMPTCRRHYPGRFDGACSLVALHGLRPSP